MKKLKLTRKHKNHLAEQAREQEWEHFAIGDKVDLYRKCNCGKRCDNDAHAEPVCRSTIIEIGLMVQGVTYTLKNGMRARANELDLVSACTPKRLQKLVRAIVREEYSSPVKGICK